MELKASAEESVSLSEKMMLDDSLLGQFLLLPGVSVLIVIKLVDFWLIFFFVKRKVKEMKTVWSRIF